MMRSIVLCLALFISTNASSQCIGTPDAGNAQADKLAACNGDTVLLTVNNSTVADGLTYQWQQSTDSIHWNDLPGITSDSFVLQFSNEHFYRRTIFCGDSFSISTPVKVTVKPILECYCRPAASICNQNDYISRIEFAALYKASTCSPNGYIDYSGAAATAIPDLVEASVVPISVTVSSGGTEYVVLWIDYNHNGTFDSDEYTYVGVGNGTTLNSAVHIPVGAVAGLTKMRIRMKFNLLPSSTEACSAYTHGETEDYLVNILAAPACNGTPYGGSAAASNYNVCSTDSSILTVDGATNGFTGLSYQWQQSNDSITWTNIPGYTSYSATIFQDSATFYRRITACGTLEALSTVVKIKTKDSTLCYCRPASSQCNTTATITNVTISNLSNNSTCAPMGYADYTTLTPAILLSGNTATINLSVNALMSTYTNYFAAWIDYNQNGIFEADEFTNLGNLQGPGTLTSSITVPVNAVDATTGMRIRSRYNAAFTAPNACTAYTMSETEDYLVHIDANCVVNTWTGLGGDNNWETATNWSCQQVPGEDATVIINSGTVNINSNVTISSLVLNPQAILSITPSFHLTITH